MSKKEKSEKVVMKSVKDTVKALNENPSKIGKEQVKLIGASLASLRFGVPEIGLTVTEEQQSIEMKRKLLAGEERVLKGEAVATRQKFPPQVSSAMSTVETQSWDPKKENLSTLKLLDLAILKLKRNQFPIQNIE